ncbi:hypothetical protein D3C76_1229090 [compost metagenome]
MALQGTEIPFTHSSGIPHSPSGRYVYPDSFSRQQPVHEPLPVFLPEVSHPVQHDPNGQFLLPLRSNRRLPIALLRAVISELGMIPAFQRVIDGII